MTASTAENTAQRFAFGSNWKKYALLIDDARIARAEESLEEMLGTRSLNGQTFLDIGSGSGLFSLAARRMGARVYSFDYDVHSVQSTAGLKSRYFPDDSVWEIAQGSVLDSDYMHSLGKFNVVYSWGVLHHTGDMWRALAQAAEAVSPGGLLYIAIYNDQGLMSRVWKRIKFVYNWLPKPFRFIIVIPSFLAIKVPAFIRDLLTGKPFNSWRRHTATRGMSPWRDLIDWVGGYPFEVAKPEQIIDFLQQRNMRLRKLKTCGGKMGCNEFVFSS
jgi:2-polyprenyl-3-methyl-5-hydroxy-6-metoxy-1,4-benzoquinol methylase